MSSKQKGKARVSQTDLQEQQDLKRIADELSAIQGRTVATADRIFKRLTEPPPGPAKAPAMR